MPPAPLAILLSGSGRTLDNLLAAIARGDLPARVALVIASRPCPGADKARAAGFPTLIVPGSIPAHDLERLLTTHGVTPDAGWVVLAGYLKLVNIPPAFAGRVVNIHPALLPKFGGPGMHGRRVHQAVLDAREPESGCTVHLCDDRFDTGPIILQRRCPVHPGDTADTLAARVFEQECLAYPEALRTLIARDAAPPAGAPESWGVPTTRVLLGIALGGILIWSGVAKLFDPADARAFAAAVVPGLSAPVAAAAVIASSILECLLGLWLVIGLRRRAALILFAALMLLFTALLALALARGYQGSCGCFGSGSGAAGHAILRNLILAAIALLGLTLLPKRR